MRAHRCEEGLRPSRSKSLDLALRSSPWGGRSAPPPRVTFPSRRKSPKARQGLRPLESPGAGSPPFSRSLRCAPARAGLPSATNPDRFATLSLWANRSFFLLRFLRGHTFWFQAVARQVGELMVRVASALDRGQGLPIFLSLIQGKLLDTRWGVRAVHSRKGLIRRQDTADRVLTTDNDNQGGQDFFSPIYPLLSIFLFYI